MSCIEKEIALSLPDGPERDFRVMMSFMYEDRKMIYDVKGSFPITFDDDLEDETFDLSSLFDS